MKVGGQLSQAGTQEKKISKSSVLLPNVLKQKQKSSLKPTHIAPKRRLVGFFVVVVFVCFVFFCPENGRYEI